MALELSKQELPVPICFAPKCFRVISFSSLHTYMLNSDEILFLVNEIRRYDESGNLNLSVLPFTNVSKKNGGSRVFAERYGLNYNTVRCWVQRFGKELSKKPKCERTKGRPATFTEEDKVEFAKRLKEAELPTAKGILPLTLEQTYDLAKEIKLESTKKQYVNSAPYMNINSMKLDYRTLQRIKEETETRDRKAQALTLARNDAVRDIRLIYITAVFIYILGRYLAAPYKWNADCTTFICYARGHGQRFCVIRQSKESKQVSTLLFLTGFRVTQFLLSMSRLLRQKLMVT